MASQSLPYKMEDIPPEARERARELGKLHRLQRLHDMAAGELADVNSTVRRLTDAKERARQALDRYDAALAAIWGQGSLDLGEGQGDEDAP